MAVLCGILEMILPGGHLTIPTVLASQVAEMCQYDICYALPKKASFIIFFCLIQDAFLSELPEQFLGGAEPEPFVVRLRFLLLLQLLYCKTCYFYGNLRQS